jgi:predicted Holliday junction resolvase-like endonuclease
MIIIILTILVVIMTFVCINMYNKIVNLKRQVVELCNANRLLYIMFQKERNHDSIDLSRNHKRVP